VKISFPGTTVAAFIVWPNRGVYCLWSLFRTPSGDTEE